MATNIVDVTEQKRLNEAREDYSDNGNAWDYFTDNQARSRAYKWGEDGLGGLCDDKQRLCSELGPLGWHCCNRGRVKIEADHGGVARVRCAKPRHPCPWDVNAAASSKRKPPIAPPLAR